MTIISVCRYVFIPQRHLKWNIWIYRRHKGDGGSDYMWLCASRPHAGRLDLFSTRFDWWLWGPVCCCQHGTSCFSIYFHGRCVSPYKDSLCPTVSSRDGLHRPLRKRRRGGRVERRKERMSERERARKRSAAVQQWRTWQLSAGQKDCAEHLLLSPTPLQPPHYLSIYHTAARSNVCCGQDSLRKRGGWKEGKKGTRGTDCMMGRARKKAAAAWLWFHFFVYFE